MTKITLCAIARNEQAMLPACLASVRDVVDAIVLVDTGSTDDTVAIAERAGARVVHHVWTDDFAAARNAALEHVDGGWVLVLDADERLAPGAAAALRAAVERGALDCGLLPLHDAETLVARPEEVLSGEARRGDPMLVPRLFRLTDDLRWEGVVHEQPTGWFAAPRVIERVDAPIVHYGAVPSYRAERGKDQRNLRLLERRCKLEPENPSAHAYLCRETLRRGDARRARELAQEAWELLRASRRPGACAVPHDAVLPATLLAFLQIESRELDAAATTLDQAAPLAGEHPNLSLLRGVLHERRHAGAEPAARRPEDLELAAAAYRRALGFAGAGSTAELMPGATGWSAAVRLGTVLLLAGRPAEALESFERALAERGENVEALLGRVEARIELGDLARAVREVEPLLAVDFPDCWILAAEAGFRLGGIEQVGPLVEQARRRLGSAAPLARHRVELLERLEAAASAIPGGPGATGADRRDPPGGWGLGMEGGPRAPLSAPPPRLVEATTTPSPTPEPPPGGGGGSGRGSGRAPLSATVVVPVKDRLELLEPVLRAFLDELPTAPCALVLVDDGSEPSVESRLEGWTGLDGVFLLRHDGNRGRAAALNTGLAAATGDVVILCDADVVPAPGFVRQHLEFHARNPSPLATHLGALEWGIPTGLWGRLMGARSNPRLIGHSGPVEWSAWFTDNWSCKRELLAGCRFDPAFRAWGFEELELARRLAARGATSTLTGRALGRHLKPSEPETMLAQYERSVPNLLRLARDAHADPLVRLWLGCRFQSAELLAAAERLFGELWARVVELDEACAAAGGLCGRRDRHVDALARALSDACFRLGLARGFAALGREDWGDVPAPATNDLEQLQALVPLLALAILAEERWAPVPDPAGLRRRIVQTLGLSRERAGLVLGAVDASVEASRPAVEALAGA